MEHLTQQTNDKQQIKPAVAGLKKTQGQLGKPAGLLADAGYFSGDNVDFCEGEEITPYISDHREPHHVPLAERQPPPASDTQPADAVTAWPTGYAPPKAEPTPGESTVETVFGIVASHLRGFQGEWNLMAWLKRMHALRAAPGTSVTQIMSRFPSSIQLPTYPIAPVNPTGS